MSQHERADSWPPYPGHKGPPELCLACAGERFRAAMAAPLPTRQKPVPATLKEGVDYANHAEAADGSRDWRALVDAGRLVAAYRKRVKELQQALSDHALGVEGGGGNRVHEDRCPLCIECGGYGTVGTDDLAAIYHKPDCRVEGLLRGFALQAGAEADPDVADTAWAIIDHHARHRTAG